MYSDDQSVLVCEKFESTLGERENGLVVNPEKTDLILFSKRRSKTDFVAKVCIFGKEIVIKTEVKHV